MRKTKIVCTLGPATESEENMKKLMLNGMSVVRFNFSHQDHASHKEKFDRFCKVRNELNYNVATLMDTRGPEIRLKLFENGKTILKNGSKFVLTTREVMGTDKMASITYKNLFKDVRIGTRILINDGLIELVASEINSEDVICTVKYGGEVSSNKGINIPNITLSMPFISKQDEEDIIFGAKIGFDFIATSFTRCKEDILHVKRILKEYKSPMKIIAKIENHDGVENVEEILTVADGVMIARGDMGVEIPMEEVPIIQKHIIKIAERQCKPAIIATQMLESMLKNPRPTRAECTDIANAVYDGTAAVMLSGETAAGDFPIEALKTMALIVERTEREINYLKRFQKIDAITSVDPAVAISHAAVTTSHDLGTKAIVTITRTGHTVNMISKYRPVVPIIGCSSSPVVCRQLNLSWGVIPVLCEDMKNNLNDIIEITETHIKNNRILKNGDVIVMTGGIHIGFSGNTDFLSFNVIGNTLNSGVCVNARESKGRICVCNSDKEAKEKFRSGDILVLKETSEEYLEYIKDAAGIITEECEKSSYVNSIASILFVPVIVDMKNATKKFTDNTLLYLNTQMGVAYVVEDTETLL